MECSLCELSLNEKDDIVITECKHQFHRTCAQDRLLKKNRSDCFLCSKASALRKAINDHPTVNNQNVNSVYGKKSQLNLFQITTNENRSCWMCEQCYKYNDPVQRKCQSCGKLRYTLARNPSTTEGQFVQCMSSVDSTRCNNDFSNTESNYFQIFFLNNFYLIFLQKMKLTFIEILINSYSKKRLFISMIYHS